ncbi:MAG: glycoside hydrolase family 13 protein [Planctomycetes bacterium]|nr:glycoside hydrolase family 13 protein [Planctomycetota bacterium]
MTAHTHDLGGRPAWAKDAVFYHIFPDRFARSERVPQPSNLLPWSSPPSQEAYHGGDLLGVAERLDYLADLGVNAIYLTPIFQSACNHRYHTHDYKQVDPLLGGNAALRELIEQAHAREMRIILDGVFNHASRGFFQFNDILENGPHSPWLDWFFVEDWPLSAYDGSLPANYCGWVNNRALPKFNTDNPQVREFLMDVAEFWVREYDIDGWRLDVPPEITTPGFWEEFRRRVRAIKPDAYLVGEIWREAPQWVRGDRFDATMNYVFAAAAIAFCAGDRVSRTLVEGRSYDPYPGVDAVQFGRRIERLLALYDWETTQVQFNLLDSHDAPRVLSIARGDKATLRLATLLQMTFPGTPSIYYGDEIALPGAEDYDGPHRDHDARRSFPWDDEASWDHEMLEYFRRAIALRHAHPALCHGEFKQLYADNRQYVFARSNESETLLVALNAGDEAAELPVATDEFFAQDRARKPIFGTAPPANVNGGRATLSLPARAGAVFSA